MTIHTRPIRQCSLIDYVNIQHRQQLRKYTNEPYFIHLKSVAEMAEPYGELLFEVGLCHDLLEDTKCTKNNLQEALSDYGYSKAEIDFIVSCVVQLTDIYTQEDYPHLNRFRRKKQEAFRLWSISPQAQTVKYCDLIDNTSSIVQYDPNFARKYLGEKATILTGMDKGSPALFDKANESLSASIKLLSL
jgi:guanosine-3',5'-bis(diphosphate) 3'-pyrophosphohydrolase